jgi:alpha-L-rhamnosidase
LARRREKAADPASCAYARGWDDAAASFTSSDDLLNQIWELCRYSIKATTFAGVYVDGDRERIPYEADAYLNQLSHYAVEGGLSMARETFDHLMRYPTWPTEWSHHMILMAHADWMQSGETVWMAERYDSLKSELLQDRAGPAGLLVGTPEEVKKDTVDWPPGERDDFVFMPLNTVVKAFYLRSLFYMSEMARALGLEEEASEYAERYQMAVTQFHAKCFDSVRGLYRDGEGAEHHGFHANLFPLAFELVPVEHHAGILDFLLSKGMACSVYPAQYLFEALFAKGRSTDALALMMASGDRSWRHMVQSGTTITWEAWDQGYKPYQDWNHAWGAAPANLLPRYVLGVQTLAPGWKTIQIWPCPGSLQSCQGRVPTPRGPVAVEWRQDQHFTLTFEVPPGSEAVLALSVRGEGRVQVEGKAVAANRIGNSVCLSERLTGRHHVEVD